MMLSLKSYLIYVTSISLLGMLNMANAQTVDRRRGQRANVNSVINQLDSNGLRTGLWFEKEKYSEMKTLRCYKNGLPSKFYMAFFGNGNLQRFGESTEDEYSDIWYYFDERGFLVFTAEHIEKNTEYIRNKVGNELFKPDYKEYVIEYHANGERWQRVLPIFMKSRSIILKWVNGDTMISRVSLPAQKFLPNFLST